MHDPQFYDWDSQPIDDLQWQQLWTVDRHLGLDFVPPYQISTTWVGVDLYYDPDHQPLPMIFETVVYGPDGLAVPGTHRRYPDRWQAVAGHAKTVERLRAYGS